MRQAVTKGSLIDAITTDQSFRVIAAALVTYGLVAAGRNLFGDPWFVVLGNLAGLIAASTLLLLLLRVVQEIIKAGWGIIDELRRNRGAS